MGDHAGTCLCVLCDVQSQPETHPQVYAKREDCELIHQGLMVCWLAGSTMQSSIVNFAKFKWLLQQSSVLCRGSMGLDFGGQSGHLAQFYCPPSILSKLSLHFCFFYAHTVHVLAHAVVNSELCHLMPTEMCPVTCSNMVWGGSYPLDEHSVHRPILDLHCPLSVWNECGECPMTAKRAANFTVDWLLGVRSRLGEPPISHHTMCPPICFMLCGCDAAEGKLQFYLDCSVIAADRWRL